MFVASNTRVRYRSNSEPGPLATILIIFSFVLLRVPHPVSILKYVHRIVEFPAGLSLQS